MSVPLHEIELDRLSLMVLGGDACCPECRKTVARSLLIWMSAALAKEDGVIAEVHTYSCSESHWWSRRATEVRPKALIEGSEVSKEVYGGSALDAAEISRVAAWEEWWTEIGRFIDPDTEDVDWQTKARFLAQAEFKAASDQKDAEIAGLKEQNATVHDAIFQQCLRVGFRFGVNTPDAKLAEMLGTTLVHFQTSLADVNRIMTQREEFGHTAIHQRDTLAAEVERLKTVIRKAHQALETRECRCDPKLLGTYCDRCAFLAMEKELSTQPERKEERSSGPDFGCVPFRMEGDPR